MNMSVNNNRATHISSQSLQPAKAELQNQERKLGSEIRGVKNSIDKLDTSIKRNQTSLNTLNAISDKHGGDSSIRLKSSNFKPGSGKALFSGSRYQKERADAASKLGVPGSQVSASKAISVISSEIKSDKAKMTSLKQDLGYKETELKNVRVRQIKDENMGNVTTAKTSADKSGAQSTKTSKDFSLIYQSNAGCKALNAEARYQFGQGKEPGRLSSREVISEYQSAKGDNIFSGGNKDIKNTINACASDLSRMVSAAADAWYTPGGSNMHTFRGQGMTTAGLNSLVEQFKQDQNQVYKPGQFFSTSKSAGVAKEFASNSNDAVKVIFEIKGNSARGITVGNGLSFGNKATEEEKLYSPKANFRVNNIVRNSGEGVYKIQLQEVAQTRNAKLLPY